MSKIVRLNLNNAVSFVVNNAKISRFTGSKRLRMIAKMTGLQ